MIQQYWSCISRLNPPAEIIMTADSETSNKYIKMSKDPLYPC